MDVGSLIGLASLAGAGLFFISGYAARSLRSGGDAQASLAADQSIDQNVDDSSPDKQAVARLEQSLATLQNDLAKKEQALKAQQAQEQQKLSGLQTQLAEQSSALDAAQRRHKILSEELETAQEALAQDPGSSFGESTRIDTNISQALQSEQELVAAQQQLNDLQSKLAAAQQQQQNADAALQAEKQVVEKQQQKLTLLEQNIERQQEQQQEYSQTQMRLRELEGSIDSARSKSDRAESLAAENNQLRSALEDLRKTMTPAAEVDKLRVQHNDMLVKTKVMQEKVAELERHATDNATLRQQLGDYDGLRDERDNLQKKLQALEAKAFSAGLVTTEPTPQTASQTPPQSSSIKRRDDAKVLDTAIEKLLQSHLEKAGMHNAVLADTQGFPLAASGPGERHEALAVLSGLIAELGEQAKELLPLGGLSSCELGDGNGLHVCSQFFDSGDQALALTVLRQAAPSTKTELGSLVDAVAKMFRETEAEA